MSQPVSSTLKCRLCVHPNKSPLTSVTLFILLSPSQGWTQKISVAFFLTLLLAENFSIQETGKVLGNTLEGIGRAVRPQSRRIP